MYYTDDPNANPSPSASGFKTFATEDEFNKFQQSVSSKAKGEILKEIGVSSVSDVKDRFTKLPEYEKKASEYDKLFPEFEKIRQERDASIDALIVTKFGVNDEFKNEFLTLAKAGVKENITLEQSAEAVFKKLTSTSIISNPKIKIGGDTKPPQFEATQLDKIRQAAGLKAK